MTRTTNKLLLTLMSLLLAHCVSTKSHVAKRGKTAKAKPVVIETIEHEDFALGNEADQASVFNQIGSDRRYSKAFEPK
ncbi:MAG: hypothetical protein AB7T49_18725 [Oligoflexales bacterium]